MSKKAFNGMGKGGRGVMCRRVIRDIYLEVESFPRQPDRVIDIDAWLALRSHPHIYLVPHMYLWGATFLPLVIYLSGSMIAS